MRDGDRIDAAIDRVIAGDGGALPLAARVRDGLCEDVSAPARAAHLAALARAATRGGIARSRPARRFGAAALAAALVMMLSSSTALAASQGSVPGDALYGLKRAGERLSLAMHRAPSEKAELHLRFADRRLREIQTLLRNGRDTSRLQRDYSNSISLAQSLAERVGAHALLAEIERRMGRQIERLNEVLSTAPASARKGLENAIENASKTKDRAATTRGKSVSRPGSSTPGETFHKPPPRRPEPAKPAPSGGFRSR